MLKLLNCDECNCRVNQLNQSFFARKKFYIKKCEWVQTLVAAESSDKWVRAPSSVKKYENFLRSHLTEAGLNFIFTADFHTKNFETNKKKGAWGADMNIILLHVRFYVLRIVSTKMMTAT